MAGNSGEEAGRGARRPEMAKFRITGRVQGVGYRWWLCEQARTRGMGGFARNESDGSVTVLLVGSELHDAARLLENGPPSARVAAVDRLATNDTDRRWEAGSGLAVL